MKRKKERKEGRKKKEVVKEREIEKKYIEVTNYCLTYLRFWVIFFMGKEKEVDEPAEAQISGVSTIRRAYTSGDSRRVSGNAELAALSPWLRQK